MAKGIKFKFTVDSFKACYLANKDVIKFLNGITYEDDFYNDFKLHRMEGAGMIYDNVIQIQVQNPNDLQWMLFGKLCYTEKRQDNEGNTYVWFEIENKVFYTPLYKNMNILVFINTITEELDLVSNNITTLDIAMDSNINFSKRIKKAIFNKNFIPIINRKPYDNEREEIKGVRFNYGTNQIRLLDLALYIKQSCKDGFELKGYDKGKELEYSQKEYIKKWLDMKHPYRLEIHLKKEHISEFYEKSHQLQLAFGANRRITPDMLISFLANSDNKLLGQLFFEYTNRLIKFKDKTTGEELSIFDV